MSGPATAKVAITASSTVPGPLKGIFVYAFDDEVKSMSPACVGVRPPLALNGFDGGGGFSYGAEGEKLGGKLESGLRVEVGVGGLQYVSYWVEEEKDYSSASMSRTTACASSLANRRAALVLMPGPLPVTIAT